LHADLRRFLNSEPVSARSIGIAPRCLLQFRKRPLVASLVATMAVGAMVAMGMIVREWRRAEANYELALNQSHLANQRLQDAESLLVRMSWALDESFWFKDAMHTFDTDFREELARDLAMLVRTSHERGRRDMAARLANRQPRSHSPSFRGADALLPHDVRILSR
jgi:hypothetical protein